MQVPTHLTWTRETAVAVGGAMALLGCFLPFVTGGGQSVNVLTIADKVNSWIWLQPISAGALVCLGLTLSPNAPAARPSASLALSSGWAGINLLFMLALSAVIGALGPFAVGGSVGIGLGLCTLGFLTSAVASFLVIRDYLPSINEER